MSKKETEKEMEGIMPKKMKMPFTTVEIKMLSNP